MANHQEVIPITHTIPSKYLLSAQQKLWVQENLPGVVLQESDGGRRPQIATSDHPCAALSRLVACRIVARMTSNQRVIEIGADPMRIRLLGLPWYSNLVSLNQHDVHKNATAEQPVGVCACPLGRCGHLEICDVAVSIDRIHSMSPRTIANIVASTRNKVYFHVFSRMSTMQGTAYNGEVSWCADNHGSVRVTATGEVAPYSSTTLPWLGQKFLPFTIAGERVILTWTQTAAVGEFIIVRFGLTAPTAVQHTNALPCSRLVHPNRQVGVLTSLLGNAAYRDYSVFDNDDVLLLRYYRPTGYLRRPWLWPALAAHCLRRVWSVVPPATKLLECAMPLPRDYVSTARRNVGLAADPSVQYATCLRGLRSKAREEGGVTDAQCAETTLYAMTECASIDSAVWQFGNNIPTKSVAAAIVVASLFAANPVVAATGTQYFTVIVTSPIVEECVKTLPYARYIWPVLESVARGVDLKTGLYIFGVHQVFASLPLPQAILTHMAHNLYVVLTTSIQFPDSTSSPAEFHGMVGAARDQAAGAIQRHAPGATTAARSLYARALRAFRTGPNAARAAYATFAAWTRAAVVRFNTIYTGPAAAARCAWAWVRTTTSAAATFFVRQVRRLTPDPIGTIRSVWSWVCAQLAKVYGCALSLFDRVARRLRPTVAAADPRLLAAVAAAICVYALYKWWSADDGDHEPSFPSLDVTTRHDNRSLVNPRAHITADYRGDSRDRVLRPIGWYSSLHPQQAYADNEEAELAALHGRHAIEQKCDDGVLAEFCVFYVDFFTTAITEKVVPTPFAKWVARFPYGRRTALQLAKIEVDAHGWKKKYRLSKSFVKFEKGSLVVAGIDKCKPPRLIQGADLHHSVVTGPFNHAASAIYKRVFNHEAVHFYAPGATRGEITCFVLYDQHQPGFHVMAAGDDVIVKHVHRDGIVEIWEGDFSRLDARFSQRIKLAETEVDAALGASALYLAAVRASINATGVTKHGVRYWTPGTRQSGGSDTTLKNTAFALCSIAFAARHAGDVHDIEAVLAMLGFPIEFELVDLDNVSFCQLALWPCTPYWCSCGAQHDRKFGVLPGRMFARLGTPTDPNRLNPREIRNFFHSVSCGLLATDLHVPFVNTMLHKYKYLGVGGKLVGKYRKWMHFTQRDHVLPLAFDYYVPMLTARYGLTAAQCHAVRDYFREPSGAMPIDWQETGVHNIVTVIIDRDL